MSNNEELIEIINAAKSLNKTEQEIADIGNSFKGLYVANGMVITDKELTGTHYIGTNFSSVMAGPVTIGGTITVDGNYVVV